MKRALMFASLAALALAPAITIAGGDHDKSKTSTLTGCLSSGSESGTYRLATKDSAKESKDTASASASTAAAVQQVEVRSTKDISEHVGHEVKLTGSWMEGSRQTSDAGSAASDSPSAKTEASAGDSEISADAKVEARTGDKADKSTKHFMVTSIQHVSDTCQTTR